MFRRFWSRTASGATHERSTQGALAITPWNATTISMAGGRASRFPRAGRPDGDALSDACRRRRGADARAISARLSGGRERSPPRDRLWRRRAPDRRGDATPGRRLHRRRTLPERHGEGRGRDRRSRAPQHPPLRRRRRPPPRLAAPGVACPKSTFSIPTPGRRSVTSSAVSSAPTNLDRFARVLAPGGLFRFASDIDSYVEWTLLHLTRRADFDWTAERADDWRQPFPDWPGTRYEAKALAEGRKPAYLTFERR